MSTGQPELKTLFLHRCPKLRQLHQVTVDPLAVNQWHVEQRLEGNNQFDGFARRYLARLD